MPALVPKRHDNSVIGRCQKAGAAGRLPGGVDKCQPQPDPQPRQTVFRQCRFAAGGGAQPRPQAFIDILQQGQGDIGATMLPPPEGLWGMPLETLATLPGYDPDTAKNRAEARKIMKNLVTGQASASR
jgi:hypothetical protein